MVRILHFADLQLGKGGFPRSNDFAAVLPQIADIAKSEKVDLAVAAGDIFDSYLVDSYSGKAFRKFCESMQEMKVPLVAIEGNHEFDKKRNGDGSVARIESYSDYLIRPDREQPAKALPLDKLKMVAADWMPSSKLKDFLEQLEPDLDVLVLHQNVEGFIPGIAQCECTMEQLQGKARLVLLGDLHVNSTKTLMDGTVVHYPGSTELCAINEPHDKFVTIFDYDEIGRRVIGQRNVKLSTRPILQLSIQSQGDLEAANQAVLNSAEANPLIYVDHSSGMRRQVEESIKSWKIAGLKFINASGIPEVELAHSFSASKGSADEEMREILSQMFKDNDLERSAALDSWNNPDRTKEIIDELEARIRQEALQELDKEG